MDNGTLIGDIGNDIFIWNAEDTNQYWSLVMKHH